MSLFELHVRMTPERMVELVGFRAETECNKNARLCEGAADKSGARRWRQIAEACRVKMGVETPLIWRAKGKLF